MLSLVLCAALSQAPVKVAVVQSSNIGVPPKRAAELTALLVALMKKEQLAPIEAKLPCEDRRCLFSTGKELKTAGVVSVAFAALGKEVVMDLEGMESGAGKSLGQITFNLKNGATELPVEAASFIDDVRRALQPAAPVVADAPREQPRLLPETAASPAPELVVESPEHSRVPAVVVSAGAVALGVTAAVLMALASGDAREANRRHPEGSMQSAHTEAQANAYIASANTKYSVSAGAGIAAGVLAAGAVFLFVY